MAAAYPRKHARFKLKIVPWSKFRDDLRIPLAFMIAAEKAARK
jgi:hypothetical protein